eukprot:TRINITY_DN2906_c0_g1_i1.p1 TRINITY_DN2906_c0_g1~~TRINITY_DN2906_c0_g1_i1.p1  ORF type:complete len:482 (-),score=87.96 TRINITY_DN2906_c0_g1_i1:1901-3316(-)
MDPWMQLDAPVLSRLLPCLPQKEALTLAGLARQWTQLAGNGFRLLTIGPGTPLAAAAAATSAGGFKRLRALIVDCRQGDTSFCVAVAELLRRLCSHGVQLERLALRGLILQEAELGLAVARMKLFEAWLQLALSSPALRKLQIDDLDAGSPGAPPAALQRIISMLESPSLSEVLVELKLSKCCQGLRCVRSALFGRLGPQLEHLDLSSSGLRAGGVGTIAQALPQMLQLKTLLLADNGMGPQGAISLARGLEALAATLQELDLSANGLGIEGLQILTEPLRRMQQLRVLRLRGSWAGDADGVGVLLELLAPLASQLNDLDLSNNRLGVSSMRSLLAQLPLMPGLQTLNLSENHFANSDFGAQSAHPNLRALAEVAPALTDLNLGCIGLGSDESALRAISSVLPNTLEKLYLSASKLHAPHLQILQATIPPLPRLRHLVLVQAQMDDIAANVLAAIVDQKHPGPCHPRSSTF